MKNDVDEKRRAALASLAKLSVYSAPAVVSLLSPAISHAQTSLAANTPGKQARVAACNDPLNFNVRSFSGNQGFGFDSCGPNSDTTADCPLKGNQGFCN